MDKKFKTYRSSNNDYESFKLNKKVLIEEPQPLWDNFIFGFGNRINSLLDIKNFDYKDIFRLGGQMRHRRLTGRFYQVWADVYDSAKFSKAKSKWYNFYKSKDSGKGKDKVYQEVGTSKGAH